MSESWSDASVGWIGLRSGRLKELGRWSFALETAIRIYLGFDGNSHSFMRRSSAKLLYCKLANVESSLARLILDVGRNRTILSTVKFIPVRAYFRRRRRPFSCNDRSRESFISVARDRFIRVTRALRTRKACVRPRPRRAPRLRSRSRTYDRTRKVGPNARR